MHQGHRGNDEYGAGNDEGNCETLSQIIDGAGKHRPDHLPGGEGRRHDGDMTHDVLRRCNAMRLFHAGHRDDHEGSTNTETCRGDSENVRMDYW